MSTSIEYFGFIVGKKGGHISTQKTKELIEMPAPEDISQFGSFLGMMNRYAKFLPSLSKHCSFPRTTKDRCAVAVEWRVFTPVMNSKIKLQKPGIWYISIRSCR